MRDINESQVQIQLQTHFAERLMYLEKTNGHCVIFQSCSWLLLLLEKANVLTLCSSSVSQLPESHTGTVELAVVRAKSTKISSSPAEMVFKKQGDTPNCLKTETATRCDCPQTPGCAALPVLPDPG